MNKLKIQKNKELANYSTFKIGGSAEFFVEAKTLEDIRNAYEYAKEDNLDINIMAGGSNILINDKGVKGLVIKLANDNVEFRGERIVAGAGVNLIALSRMAANNGLSGLEWAIGIPGTVGGAILMSANAFGGTISDIAETVVTLNTDTHDSSIFSRNDCEFSYKKSVFLKRKELLVWEATLKLEKDEKHNIDSRIDKINKKRNASQPKLPSAGCVFKNIDFAKVKENSPEIADEALKAGAVANNVLASAWLIDNLGFKGKAIGGAKISLEHANFIVNTGSAKAEDVVLLISFIKQQVRNEFKLQLSEEIVYFGF